MQVASSRGALFEVCRATGWQWAAAAAGMRMRVCGSSGPLLPSGGKLSSTQVWCSMGT